MRAPAFWFDNAGGGLAATALSPLAAVWTAATRRRLATGAWQKLPVPVICVGNVNVGGTGKTPTVISLLEQLTARGIEAHVVSRGYGGDLAGPVRVDTTMHRAADVGDEPLLLAALGPTWVSRDRTAGAKAAVKAGAQAILLDDGLQNPALSKDLSILVVDAAQGFGNGRVMPAGPLREPLADALDRADVILSIGASEAQDTFRTRCPAITGLPRATARIAPLDTGMHWAGLRVFAFAGIGRPQKFFDTLDGLGATLVGTQSFDDHQRYAPALLRRLEQDATAKGAQLVTTEKDAVRLPPEFRRNVLSLPVRLVLQDSEALDAALAWIVPDKGL